MLAAIAQHLIQSYRWTDDLKAKKSVLLYLSSLDSIIYGIFVAAMPTRLANNLRSSPMNFTEKLNHRRRELGMTFAILSKRSGLPISTLKAIFGKGVEQASFSSVSRIANALGIDVELSDATDSYQLLKQQATQKARELVGMVQATSGLEAQALPQHQIEAMTEQLIHQLMAGSRRKLWA
jgi:predicted transcriptional regulator